MDQSGYVRPGEVRSPRRYWTLSDEEPLYDGGENEWSAAWGEWTGEDGHAKRCIGVRWNGNDEKPLGHPSGHGHATWFILPRNWSMVFLTSLRERRGGQASTIRTAAEPLVFEPPVGSSRMHTPRFCRDTADMALRWQPNRGPARRYQSETRPGDA